MNTDRYPQTFIIDGNEYSGRRKLSSSIIIFPETHNLDIVTGQTIIQKIGEVSRILVVEKVFPSSIGILMRQKMNLDELSISVEVKEMPQKNDNPNINIGSINTSQMQVGNNNTQITNITIQELIEKVTKTDDKEAKSLLKQLFENPTVASILGAATGGFIGLL